LLNPQLALVIADEIETADEPVTVIDNVAVQLLALLTVTAKIPAARAEISSVVDPLLQANVYGEISPLGVRFIEPLFNPQLVFVIAEEIVRADDPVTVTDDVAVQLPELVAVTL
jgi:hypothetical protein